jgi:hypothetical protein
VAVEGGRRRVACSFAPARRQRTRVEEEDVRPAGRTVPTVSGGGEWEGIRAAAQGGGGGGGRGGVLVV